MLQNGMNGNHVNENHSNGTYASENHGSGRRNIKNDRIAIVGMGLRPFILHWQ